MPGKKEINECEITGNPELCRINWDQVFCIYSVFHGDGEHFFFKHLFGVTESHDTKATEKQLFNL